jgi:hypothetical protein
VQGAAAARGVGAQQAERATAPAPAYPSRPDRAGCPCWSTTASRPPSCPVAPPRKFHSMSFTTEECSMTTCETEPFFANGPSAIIGTRVP